MGNDLRTLMQCVRDADVFILMLTDGVLSRPWCLVELHTAIEANIPIIVLRVNNAFACPAEKAFAVLKDLPAYLEEHNKGAMSTLTEHNLDAATLGPHILQALPEDEPLVLNPNESAVMLRSLIEGLAKAMVQRATPENEQLLSFLDVDKVEPDPWVFRRPVAVYIIFAECGSMEVLQGAHKIKDWLAQNAGLDASKISLCSLSAGDISDVASASIEDCQIAMRDTDVVMLLQTKQALEEPRCLSRLYMAAKFEVPIVPVCLSGLTASDQQYNFETAKPWLQSLEANLGDAARAANITHAVGTTVEVVGNVLAETIPNMISKPLGMNSADSDFQAQMLDIELTLRRTLSTQNTPTTAPFTDHDGGDDDSANAHAAEAAELNLVDIAKEEQKALVDVGGKESVHGVATRVRGSYGVSSTTSSRTVTPPREEVTPPRAVSRPRTPPLVDL